MPAWNQRYHEICIAGAPVHLMLSLLLVTACLFLAVLALINANWLMGLGLSSIAGIALQTIIRKIRLGAKRGFDRTILDARDLDRLVYNDKWEKLTPAHRDFEKRKLPRRLYRDAILNDDGSVTIAISHRGYALYLNPDEKNKAFNTLQSVLRKIDKTCLIEFHLCRRRSADTSNRYRNHPLLRQRRITAWIRNKIADLYQQNAFQNQAWVLLTIVQKRRSWWRAGQHLKQQIELVESADTIARQISSSLPDAKIDTLNAYRSLLKQTYHQKSLYPLDSAEQCVGWFAAGRCTRDQDLIHLPDGRYLKSIWLENYPDAQLGFVCRLTQMPIAIHIVQAIKTIGLQDRHAIQRDINISASMMSGGNLAGAHIKFQAHRDMQNWCAQNDHPSYWNFYAIQLIDHDPERIRRAGNNLIEWLNEQGGTARDYAEIQMSAWHYLLPGVAHYAQRWRIDEITQLIAMCPVHIPDTGAEVPISLRMSTQNTPVAIGYQKGDVAHHVTIAMTGAGKSLDRCARILESYGAGIDIYALEIGQSLWWAIEAVGGQYHRLDPDEIMINPMPDRNCCVDDELPIEVLTTTTTALSMLLGSQPVLNQFELTATQIAIQNIYLQPNIYPNVELQHLRQSLEDSDYEKPALKEAANRMAEHLDAFLQSSEGQRLTRLPKLRLKPGAIGCDLSQIKMKAPTLLKFYLIFISLKYSQLAYAHNNPAEIILDEMHEFVRLAPDVMGPLIDGLARMGRKNACYINLITQEVDEIEAIGKSVLNQILRKCLLYKQSEHQKMADRLAMPIEVLNVWKSWKNPLSHPFRYALECLDGERWHELLLTYPKEILILSRTDPVSLEIKRRISQMTTDPIRRLQLFEQMLDQPNAG